MHSIWYITKYFSPKTITNRGGRDHSLLVEMAKQNIQITAIVSDTNHVVDMPKLSHKITLHDDNGIKLVWLKTYQHKVAKSLHRIIGWLHFEWRLFWLNTKLLPKPDIIIISSLSILTILNGIRLKHKYKCKLVFEIKDIWPLTIIEEGGFNKNNILVRGLAWIEKIGYKKADLIVGTMPNLSQHVENILGYKKETICIPMGITEEMINLPDNLLSENFIQEYIPNHKFIITYAGTIGISNALEVFFKAITNLQHHPHLHFLIVGDGALRTQYIQQYSHLSNITFVPKVSRNQVPSILSHSHLLYFSVFPSEIWKYGQSLNKLIDYMLAGKPILASYSGYQSMINEANCGEFITAGDSDLLVRKILEYSNYAPEKLDTMGSNGKNWIKKQRSYKTLASAYIKALKL